MTPNPERAPRSLRVFGAWHLATTDIDTESHTKKPTKPTEWTIRRPSVGQKIRKRYVAAYSTQSPWAVGLDQVEHLLCKQEGQGFEAPHVHPSFQLLALSSSDHLPS